MLKLTLLERGRLAGASKSESHRSLYKDSGTFSFMYVRKLLELGDLAFIASEYLYVRMKQSLLVQFSD